MNNNLNNESNKYAWNDSMILDKIEEILGDKNIDELELTKTDLENIKSQLNESLSYEELNNSGCIIAESIDDLKVLPEENIRQYISKLINYLDVNNLTCILGEFEGIEFEVYKDSDVDEVFKKYYSKYDEIYQISDMLSDLGLKK